MIIIHLKSTYHALNGISTYNNDYLLICLFVDHCLNIFLNQIAAMHKFSIYKIPVIPSHDTKVKLFWSYPDVFSHCICTVIPQLRCYQDYDVSRISITPKLHCQANCSGINKIVYFNATGCCNNLAKSVLKYFQIRSFLTFRSYSLG